MRTIADLMREQAEQADRTLSNHKLIQVYHSIILQVIENWALSGEMHISRYYLRTQVGPKYWDQLSLYGDQILNLLVRDGFSVTTNDNYHGLEKIISISWIKQ